MANTLQLEIVTPEATVYSETVEMVTLPAVEGQMGILPHHVRLMTQLVPGELIVRKDGHEEYLAVGEGLVEVTNEHVSIVTNMAISIENIDEAAGGGSTSTRCSSPERKTLFRRGCLRKRLASAFSGTAPR